MSLISETDQSRFKKLKPSQAWEQFLKVTFFKDGLVEGDDSEDSDGKKPKGREIMATWFFQCADDLQRDALMSQIFINALAKWELNGPPADFLRDTQTQEILEDWILMQEKKGVKVRILPDQDISSGGGGEDEDDTESL